MADNEKKEGLIPALAGQLRQRRKDWVHERTRKSRDAADRVMNAEAVTLLKSEYLVPRRVKEIAPDTYIFTEALFSSQYLFLGEKKALLIDTGLGLAGLRDEVEKLLDGRELVVAATHSSPFCVGGAAEFDKVLIHKKDLRVAKENADFELRGKLARFLPLFRFMGLGPDDIIREKGKFKALDPDETIDLGGRDIKVKSTPAQTPGSLTFHDEKENITVSGSVTSPVSLMIWPRAASLEDYHSSIETVVELQGDGTNWCTHWFHPLRPGGTADLRILVNGILDNDNDRSRLVAVEAAGFKRLLVYRPYKLKRKNWKKKLETIWND